MTSEPDEDTDRIDTEISLGRHLFDEVIQLADGYAAENPPATAYGILEAFTLYLWDHKAETRPKREGEA